ncbi:hypothetical protein K488DRAFT_74492 [Vararia minispora EC-137]|uniref:Uncharacterized protein n=1 Tax=Vararia minispora EC-137 TaxID=1314806 RepID=A0ACB8Q7G7_9AGAM|nr:hypothetical protein K488DRAFT_74492 [Vararia minispora EC-137]
MSGSTEAENSRPRKRLRPFVPDGFAKADFLTVASPNRVRPRVFQSGFDSAPAPLVTHPVSPSSKSILETPSMNSRSAPSGRPLVRGKRSARIFMTTAEPARPQLLSRPAGSNFGAKSRHDGKQAESLPPPFSELRPMVGPSRAPAVPSPAMHHANHPLAVKPPAFPVQRDDDGQMPLRLVLATSAQSFHHLIPPSVTMLTSSPPPQNQSLSTPSFIPPARLRHAVVKEQRQISTTRVARVTDLRDPSGAAELFGIIMQDSRGWWPNTTDKALTRGLQISPRKLRPGRKTALLDGAKKAFLSEGVDAKLWSKATRGREDLSLTICSILHVTASAALHLCLIEGSSQDSPVLLLTPTVGLKAGGTKSAVYHVLLCTRFTTQL